MFYDYENLESHLFKILIFHFCRFTLFDDPKDDLFDGELGQDDFETPRVLLNFIHIEESDSLIEESGKITITEECDKKMSQEIKSDSQIKENDENLKNSFSFEKSSPEFEDKSEQLKTYYHSLLENVNAPEDLVQISCEINKMEKKYEHPMLNEFIQRDFDSLIEAERKTFEKYKR